MTKLRSRSLCRKSLRQRVNLLVPLVQKALALRRAAVFREVVVDELDVAHLRRGGRNRRRLVRRRLEILGVRSDLLRRWRERPVVELFGVLEVPGALDDA